MTLWKPSLGLALAAVVSACAPTTPAPYTDGASAAPAVGRAARTPGTLSSMDIVRAVQSSL